jgi:hypothetical protein
MEVLFFLITITHAILMGSICAFYAMASERNTVLWFVLGAVFGAFALFYLLYRRYNDFLTKLRVAWKWDNVKKDANNQLNAIVASHNGK